MPTGTLANLGSSGFVRTPPAWARRIAHHLLRFPESSAGGALTVNVYDPTCGEGDLLLPCAALPGVRLFGTEISEARAARARQVLQMPPLPPAANIVTTAVEAARITPGSIQLLLVNPPYFFADGRRAEYRIISDAGQALCPGGILVAIVPARSGWTVDLINHVCKCYEQVRCWKFPDAHPGVPDEDDLRDVSSGSGQDTDGGAGTFERYTQIVVVGVRRATPLSAPETHEKERLSGWRWRKPKRTESAWGQGFPPHELPAVPLPDPYVVPTAAAGAPSPEIVITRADETTLLRALATSGAQRTSIWQAATTFAEEIQAQQPIMPPTGEAHLAADILTGLLDGEVVESPAGEPHVFVTFVSQEWVEVEVDDEERERLQARGVVSVRLRQQQDKAVLGALNLATAAIRYYHGEAAFAFLAPWLDRLATRILAKRVPLYQLDPADWELRVVARIGADKRLPGAPYPGLVAPQQHRVYALGRALDHRGRAAIQGEPGTGKTRMSAALMARQAHWWRHAALVQRERGTPRTQERQERASTREQTAPGTRGGGAELHSSPLPHAHPLLPEACLLAPRPRWLKRLRRAWQANPRTRSLLGTNRQALGPSALPVVVATPKRVTTTWEREIHAAWPAAEVMHVAQYPDVLRWLRRCAVSGAPAVVAIIPHSLSRAFGRAWQPAVIEKAVTCQVPDLNPPTELRAALEARTRDGKVMGYVRKDTGQLLTKAATTSYFYCPDCGARIDAVPRSAHQPGASNGAGSNGAGTAASAADDVNHDPAATDDGAGDAAGTQQGEDDALEPVTSITYFRIKPRACPQCRAALWTDARLPTIERKYPRPDYVAWSAGVMVATRTGLLRRPLSRHAARIVDARGTLGAASPDSFSPYECLYRFFRGCVALTIVDESHNARGRSTDIAQSIHYAQLASQTYVYASGTHYGGVLDDLYWYWFRFHPAFWRRLGLGWDEVERAVQRYGVIQEWVKEYESDARRGSGRTDLRTTVIPAPGISARLIPHLLTDLVFLSVLDVGAHMPERREVPAIVPMADQQLPARVAVALQELEVAEHALAVVEAQTQPQDADVQRAVPPPSGCGETATAATADGTPDARDEEEQDHQGEAESRRRQRGRDARAAVDAARQRVDEAKRWAADRDLERHYRTIATTLHELAAGRNAAATLAQGTVPRWWSILPAQEPRFTVTQVHRDEWGNVVDKETILTTPLLAADHQYPLERRLLAIVEEELGAGRTVMVYFEQNQLRSTAQRLEWVLGRFHPWILPNSVEAEDREDAIHAAVRSGRQVVIVPYKRVAEGINLQSSVDVICWFEVAQNLFLLDQASRRIWRLGRREPAIIYYLAYAGSAAHDKLRKLGSETGAAAAFAGEVAKGALVEHVGAHKTVLARLSRSLEHLASLGAAADAADTGASAGATGGAMEAAAFGVTTTAHSGVGVTTLFPVESAAETGALDADAANDELRAAFARRAEELREALQRGRMWYGIADSLPQRLAVLHTAPPPEEQAAFCNIAPHLYDHDPADVRAEEAAAIGAATAGSLQSAPSLASNTGSGLLVPSPSPSPTAPPVSTAASALPWPLVPVATALAPHTDDASIAGDTDAGEQWTTHQRPVAAVGTGARLTWEEARRLAGAPRQRKKSGRQASGHGGHPRHRPATASAAPSAGDLWSPPTLPTLPTAPTASSTLSTPWGQWDAPPIVHDVPVVPVTPQVATASVIPPLPPLPALSAVCPASPMLLPVVEPGATPAGVSDPETSAPAPDGGSSCSSEDDRAVDGDGTLQQGRLWT